jgi:hypothetical protein
VSIARRICTGAILIGGLLRNTAPPNALIPKDHHASGVKDLLDLANGSYVFLFYTMYIMLMLSLLTLDHGNSHPRFAVV